MEFLGKERLWGADRRAPQRQRGLLRWATPLKSHSPPWFSPPRLPMAQLLQLSISQGPPQMNHRIIGWKKTSKIIKCSRQRSPSPTVQRVQVASSQPPSPETAPSSVPVPRNVLLPSRPQPLHHPEWLNSPGAARDDKPHSQEEAGGRQMPFVGCISTPPHPSQCPPSFPKNPAVQQSRAEPGAPISHPGKEAPQPVPVPQVPPPSPPSRGAAPQPSPYLCGTA